MEPLEPPPRWHREQWVFLVALLLIVGGIVAFFALRDGDGETRERAVVPRVVGLHEENARATLEESGFAVEVVRGPADEREGIVVDQDPGGGSRLPLGGTVLIAVSLGPEATRTETQTVTETVTAPSPTTMPDVLGLDYLEAAAAVFSAGAVADTYPVESSEPRGTVVRQSPQAGTEVEEGAIVRLDVSLGAGERGDRDVPKVIGLGLAAAHELCREAGFTCRTVERDAPRVEDVGEVFDQRPAAGRVELELTQMTLYSGR